MLAECLLRLYGFDTAVMSGQVEHFGWGVEHDWVSGSTTIPGVGAGSRRGGERVGFERRWAGLLDSADPSDAGPSCISVIRRGGPALR